MLRQVRKSLVLVDFGDATGGRSITGVTVLAPWLLPTSFTIAQPIALTTDDHDPDDYAVEGVRANTANPIPGVSFDVIVSGNNTFGKYYIEAIGII